MDENQIIRELTSHENRLTEHDREIRDIKKRQDNVDEMVKAVAALGVKQEAMDGDLKEIKADVKSLKDVPAARWNTVIAAVISALVGGIIGFILFRAGLG